MMVSPGHQLYAKDDDMRRAVVVAAVMSGIALGAAACGGSAVPPKPGTEAYYQDAIAYSQCMRGHGEPGFPDPQPNGDILINGPQDHLAGGAVMARAQQACGHLLPKQAPLTAAQQRQIADSALKFVACMQAHGIANFPDPVVNSQGVSVRLPPGITPDSPLFQAAQQACRKLMPGGPP